tara:strand:- start:64 stop:246 length:183 start_codon:yes stop_codon:yes gene_type:complete
MNGWIEVWDRYNGEKTLVSVSHIVCIYPQANGTNMLLTEENFVNAKQDYEEVKRLIGKAS